MSRFTGFTQQGLTFLQQLSHNNNKEWFEEHREVYDQQLIGSFRNLVEALSLDMLAIDDMFEVKSAIGKTISRIYRDTRFSSDKSLYRSNIWLTFKRSRKNWTDAPTYFFELGPDWWRYGLGYYSASRTTMDLFRQQVLRNPAAFLESVSDLNPALSLEGETYKRPLIKDQSPELASWYNKKSFALIGHCEDMETLFDENLVDSLRQAFHSLAPLYDFLLKIEQMKKAR